MRPTLSQNQACLRSSQPRRNNKLLVMWLIVLAICVPSNAIGFQEALGSKANPNESIPNKNSDDLRVMSFNIRFGTANDGPNHWNNRHEFLVDTIREFQPDLLGTQETLAFQRDYLAKQLEDYDHMGVGRDDGKEAGEMMAIYWKRERFEKIDAGHFWLSETPETIASKSWDTSLPRMVTWVKLQDRRQSNAKPIVWFNTHFDHRGPEARLESAKLLRQRALELATDALILITGDFNASEGSPPYAALFAPVEPGQTQIVDTYRHLHPQRTENEGTFSGFDGAATGGDRIDWLGACDRWQIVSAAIDRTQKEGRTPSDHFPVTAVLRYKSLPAR